MALVIESRDTAQWIGSPLARLVARAHTLHAALVNGDDIATLAARERVGRPYMLRMLRLACLAPDIVEAILTGGAAASLTVSRLMKQIRLPLDWPSQRRALGHV